MNGAEHLVETLADQGVEICFAHRYRSLRSFSRISHSGVYGGYLSSNRLTEIPLNTFDRLHLLPGSDKARLVEL